MIIIPEVLIHFIIPLFVLTILGFNLKKSMLISSLAVIPDLDVIFHVHRSVSHSVIFILAVTVPIVLILNYLEVGKKNELVIAILVILSHPFMDIFTGFTPILWPLFDRSVYILAQLTTNMNNILALNLIFKVNLDKVVFLQTTNSEGPIFTSQGFGMTLVLLIGLAMKYLSAKIHSVTSITRYGIICIGKRLKR